MSGRRVFGGPGQVVVAVSGDEVLLTIEGIGREGLEPANPALAAELDALRASPGDGSRVLVRSWGTAWSVPSPQALGRVLDWLAVAGFERTDAPADLRTFGWPGTETPVPAELPDLAAWKGRSLASFLRRYGSPHTDVPVHWATSGIRSVSRRAYYSVDDLHFVVETDPYAVLTLTGPKPPPTAESLRIGQHTVFSDAASLRHAIERWPRDL